MDDDEDFWGDLLGHIRQRVLVPVVGPHVITVLDDGAHRPLTEVIARRLVEKFDVTVDPDHMTMGEAAQAVVRLRDRRKSDRLYRVVNDVIRQHEEEPSAALRSLAAITDIRLFVSTTPDRMLAKAINEVRSNDRRSVRELTYAPTQATGAVARTLDVPDPADTVVVRLFGEATSTAQYAIHDEDLLEWLHSLASGSAALPEWASSALRRQPLLFIGCEIPDWLGRILMRLSSETRLSMERKEFFFVDSATTDEPLSTFISTYGVGAQVQRLTMDPSEFVTELHTRWQHEHPHRPPPADDRYSGPGAARLETIFISYAREDIAAASRLADSITKLGGDVWLDKRRLSPGADWDDEIEQSIAAADLFIAVISTNTERQDESYVFSEWKAAVKRWGRMLGRPFIVPVVVDVDPGDMSTYRRLPRGFKDIDFGFAPEGVPDPLLCSTLIEHIRAMRRPGPR